MTIDVTIDVTTDVTTDVTIDLTNIIGPMGVIRRGMSVFLGSHVAMARVVAIHRY